MNVLAILSAPAAVLVLSPAPAVVAEDGNTEVEMQATAAADVEAQTIAEIESAVEESVAARITEIQAEAEKVAEAKLGTAVPVQLVSWDGDFELMKASRRMRIWRSHIAYNLMVDAAGNATGCELTETFRMRRISDRLCEVLMENHTFQPAQNANGEAVEGTYSSRLSYREMQERL